MRGSLVWKASPMLNATWGRYQRSGGRSVSVPLGSVSVASLLKEFYRVDEVLVVHPYGFLANTEVEVEIAAGGAIECQEWLDE